MEEELIANIEKLDLGSQLGTSGLVDVFKELRRSKIRRPDIVCKHGSTVLARSSSEEAWNVHEQILIASLDLGDLESAKKHRAILTAQFPGSSRVERLEGMVLEASGDYSNALKVYEKMLGVNHANLAIMKRVVACRRAEGKTTEAVNDLINIVTNFPGDSESWLELADLYLLHRNYEKAAFCFEEIVLIDPTKSHYHNKLADLYYTLGTPSDAKEIFSEASLKYLLLSRKHYSISLTLQEAIINRKAIYGVQYACKAIHVVLESGSKNNDTEIERYEVNKEMMKWSKEQVDVVSIK